MNIVPAGEQDTAPPLVEDCAWMADTGETWLGAARRLGKSPATLERTLERHGRHDLTVALKANGYVARISA